MKKSFTKVLLSFVLLVGLTMGGCSSKGNTEVYNELIAQVDAKKWDAAMKVYNFNKDDMSAFDDADEIYAYAQANFQYESLIDIEGKNNKLDAFKNNLSEVKDDYSGKYAEEIKAFKAKLEKEIVEVEALPE